uniref:Uncharacterized protein n=1 Tax=Mucochytrium quahogii TaxID=96639 RepID=A0A7S2W3S6_9STRA|mmetsp:Transcript_16216/g.26441  ORF Transcript_16216/g.26441 Transcript_16216/m.26441 type:complete len:121 (-) Transcript_16216:740-1102(-)
MRIGQSSKIKVKSVPKEHAQWHHAHKIFKPPQRSANLSRRAGWSIEPRIANQNRALHNVLAEQAAVPYLAQTQDVCSISENRPGLLPRLNRMKSTTMVRDSTTEHEGYLSAVEASNIESV